MQLLVSEKIVHANKVGRECFYNINEESIFTMIASLRSLVSGKDDKEKEKKKDKKKKKNKKEKNK